MSGLVLRQLVQCHTGDIGCHYLGCHATFRAISLPDEMSRNATEDISG